MSSKSTDITRKLADSIREQMSVDPTDEQSELLVALGEFMTHPHQRAFVLRGYAGTGKSTVVSALVKALDQFKVSSVLMAPTGRAAKVIANYSGKNALTVHKKIYFKSVNKSGYSGFTLAPNVHSKTLFVVDEASMVSDEVSQGTFGGRSLLDDLLQYVRMGRNCKLLLVGDVAQLPPVGFDDSPALDVNLLAKKGFDVAAFELRQVVRQASDSGILYNATRIREQIGVDAPVIPTIYPNGTDLRRITGHDLQDALEDHMNTGDARNAVVITRSNKRALQFNQEVRGRLFWYEEQIVAGELLMVVKNNYFWAKTSEIGFIANGDVVEVRRLHKYHQRHGFRFVEATIAFVDYPGQPEMETLLLIDSLEEPHASMPREKLKQLWNNVLLDYESEKNLGQRRKKAMNDPFMNALQVKYAYAITCHKAQGGQWPVVFIDHGYLTEEMMGNSFLRWLYTAVTRATEKAFLLNFHRAFFEED